MILFNNNEFTGRIPYKSYNCSIVKLNKEETLNITNKNYNEDSILIFFFFSSPGKRYGTMNWIGLMSYKKIINILDNEKKIYNNHLWLIKPHLLQNDKGPKCADLRIFKMEKNIGVIGYTRLAPKSNTNNISDYYVRASILDTQINNELYHTPKNLFNFNEIEGGCFPSKIGNDYKKFEIKNDGCKINNIEFLIKDNINSKLITPHNSKNRHMPNKLKLNGVEVSFSKTSSNEEYETHISTKNIIPLQHINYLDNIGCFIDLFPPNLDESIITIQNMEIGKVIHTDNILIDDKFNCKKYKGSTPFIEIENSLWITIVHKRTYSKKHAYNIKYDYILVVFDSKKVNGINCEIKIPNKCINEVPLSITSLEKDFIYITGIIILDKIFDENKNLLELEILTSYGISDEKSAVSKIKIII